MSDNGLFFFHLLLLLLLLLLKKKNYPRFPESCSGQGSLVQLSERAGHVMALNHELIAIHTYFCNILSGKTKVNFSTGTVQIFTLNPPTSSAPSNIVIRVTLKFYQNFFPTFINPFLITLNRPPPLHPPE